MSQLPKLALQLAIEQLPLVQAGVPFAAVHAVPHAPQLATVLLRLTSQPLAALLSQFPKPALHAPRPHMPPAHVAAAFAGAAHTLPHDPQFETVVLVLTSQPLAAFMSQFAKPALHMPTLHRPAAHAAVPLATIHAIPHAPQLVESVWVFTHVIMAPMPQMVLGIGQSIRQAPATHICPIGQALPHMPQLVASVIVLTHVAPHIVVPIAQAHMPAWHTRPAGQAIPQAPQFMLSVCVSTHPAPAQVVVPMGHTPVSVGGLGTSCTFGTSIV
jgi:hypothetical protein